MNASPQKSPFSPPAIQNQLLEECLEMAKHALTIGRAVSPSMLQGLQAAAMAAPHEGAGAPRLLKADDLKRLAFTHSQLSRLVAPATPQTLLLLSHSARSRFSFLGPIPFVRRMMLASICCLLLFIGLSLINYVNDPAESDIFNSEGLPLLLNELFFMAAAGLGASFAALFEASRYIGCCSFEAKFEATYWIKFFLGLIAGLILVTLIPINASGGTPEVARPTLAMLGGFSATAVHRMISRMVETIESLVRGDTKALLASQESATKARALEEVTQSRMKLAAKLMSLQQKLAGGSQEQARAKLDGFVASLFSGMEGEEGWGATSESDDSAQEPLIKEE
jgi:hypothetical protein